MIMDVPSVEMGADYYLEFSTEKLVRKLQADLMGQLRRDLPGSEALHQMKALHSFLLMPHLLDGAHIRKGGFQGATDGRLEQVLLAFVLVESLVYHPFQ